MAKSEDSNKPQELLITNVSPKLKQELTNIADNMCVTRASFVKQELRKVVESYPKEMRIAKDKD
jgi:hypothetical protein